MLAIDGHAASLLEIQIHVFRLVWSILWADAQFIHILVFGGRGVQPGILQDASLIGDVEQVSVHGVGLARTRFHGDIFLGTVGNHLLTTGKGFSEFCIAPRSNHLQIRSQGSHGQLKADLIIALACGSMRDGLSVFLARYLDHSFGNQRSGDTGSKEVLAFVNGTSLHHGIDEVVGKLLLQVIDVYFGGPGLNGLFVQTFQFFLLADVGTKSDDFSGVLLLEP